MGVCCRCSGADCGDEEDIDGGGAGSADQSVQVVVDVVSPAGDTRWVD